MPSLQLTWAADRRAAAQMGSDSLNAFPFRRQCWAGIKAGLQLSVPLKPTGMSLSLGRMGFWTQDGLSHLWQHTYTHDLPYMSRYWPRKFTAKNYSYLIPSILCACLLFTRQLLNIYQEGSSCQSRSSTIITGDRIAKQPLKTKGTL